MTDIRFLLDENMPHSLRDQLLHHEPDMDVRCIGDSIAPPIGTLDPVILEWLEENQYLLVSRNRRTMPQHLKEHQAKGRHVPGLLLIRHQTTIGSLVRDLLLIWHASNLNDYQDRIEYLPLE